MAYATVQLRILSQTVFKNNLEYQLMEITNKQSQMAYQTMQLAFTNPEDPAVKALNEAQNWMDLMRKQLETQQKAAAADLESLQKLLDKNIKEGHELKWSA